MGISDEQKNHVARFISQKTGTPCLIGRDNNLYFQYESKNQDIKDFLAERGIHTVPDEIGRAFQESGYAHLYHAFYHSEAKFEALLREREAYQSFDVTKQQELLMLLNKDSKRKWKPDGSGGIMTTELMPVHPAGKGYTEDEHNKAISTAGSVLEHSINFGIKEENKDISYLFRPDTIKESDNETSFSGEVDGKAMILASLEAHYTNPVTLNILLERMKAAAKEEEIVKQLQNVCDESLAAPIPDKQASDTHPITNNPVRESKQRLDQAKVEKENTEKEESKESKKSEKEKPKQQPSNQKPTPKVEGEKEKEKGLSQMDKEVALCEFGRKVLASIPVIGPVLNNAPLVVLDLLGKGLGKLIGAFRTAIANRKESSNAQSLDAHVGPSQQSIPLDKPPSSAPTTSATITDAAAQAAKQPTASPLEKPSEKGLDLIVSGSKPQNN